MMRFFPIAQCFFARRNVGPSAFLGVTDKKNISGYDDCAGVQNRLGENYSFAHCAHGLIDEESGVWIGDVVQAAFSQLSRGLRTIDAEMTVADCAAQSIPTV